MSIRSLALILLLALAGCSSSSAVPEGLFPPEFRVRQPKGQLAESRALTTPTQIDLLVDVYNPSSEPITLKRITIQSAAGGAYRFEPASRVLNELIPPGQVRTIDLWVSAVSDSARMDPGNPVSVRGTAIFDSGLGSFRRVFIEPVIVGLGGGAVPR